PTAGRDTHNAPGPAPASGGSPSLLSGKSAASSPTTGNKLANTRTCHRVPSSSGSRAMVGGVRCSLPGQKGQTGWTVGCGSAASPSGAGGLVARGRLARAGAEMTHSSVAGSFRSSPMVAVQLDPAGASLEEADHHRQVVPQLAGEQEVLPHE